jgi:isoamylase
VRRMILDSLRYWVREMHVDGFRFDLAAALARGEDGGVMENPPVLWAIESEPALSGSRMIAEAWDAGGLNLVGSFTGERFDVWNGPFRDTVRRFLRGDDGTIEDLMARLVGSPDIFSESPKRPFGSINFVTSHDGFSLRDLVTYSQKSNKANGEENRDGSNVNLSWNSGSEGPTDDPTVNSLRDKQIKNFLCLLMLSHGTPMVLMGDECGHTSGGNNNPWCQDNELNWFDWNLVDSNAELVRFTSDLIRFTSSLDILGGNRFWKASSPEAKGDITWHGTRANQPDWSPKSRVLAFTLEESDDRPAAHVMLNTGSHPADFETPPTPPGTEWKMISDTAGAGSPDFQDSGTVPPPVSSEVTLAAHSIVVLGVQDKPVQ